MLDTASAEPRARDRFADALMSVGAPGSAVRAFGMHTVLTGLAAAADLVDADFSAHDRSHPYGPAFTFDVGELLTRIGISDTESTEATYAGDSATPAEESGAGFKRRTGLRAAAMAAQSS
jgi:hypothetical protein